MRSGFKRPHAASVLSIAICFLSGANSWSAATPQFEDYRVSYVYRGAVKPPDFGRPNQCEGTDIRCFGGDPADYAAAPVNFAGHFVIGACTCGTGCHYLFMWDAVSGKFYQRLPPGVIDIGPFSLGGVSPSGTRAKSIARKARF